MLPPFPFFWWTLIGCELAVQTVPCTGRSPCFERLCQSARRFPRQPHGHRIDVIPLAGNRRRSAPGRHRFRRLLSFRVPFPRGMCAQSHTAVRRSSRGHCAPPQRLTPVRMPRLIRMNGTTNRAGKERGGSGRVGSVASNSASMRRWVHRGHGVTASVSGKPHTRHFTASSWLLGAMGGLNDFTSILERKCLPHRLGKPVNANHHGGWALSNAVVGDGCAGPSLVNAD